MGQANKRGTAEQRAARAIARDKTIQDLGGQEKAKKYFQVVKWNREIALRSDDGGEFSIEEAETFGKNQEFIDRYQKRFQEKYNDYLSGSTDT